jgi:hypothetical protein
VLAELSSKLNLKQPDFDEVITNYLQKELLEDRYANLQQAGHTVEERVPLATVFVDLPATHEPSSEPPAEREPAQGFVQQILEAARERFDNDSIRESVRDRLRFINRGSFFGRFVLVGGPGQGKTTVGQFICQLFRTAILKQKARKVLSPDALEAVREIEAQCQSEELAIPVVRRFPLRVVLSEFAARLDSQPESLLSYLAGKIRKKTGKHFGLDDFRRWLSSYPWVLVLDGLDEVPASSNREDLLNNIRDFWVDAAGCSADILVIATTRPQGYNDDFSPKHYEHRYLAPLSNKRALHYARRLVDVRYASEEGRKEKVLNRLQRACREGSPTSRLMRSPLQVTIMAILVDRVGQPPQERWNLFKEYYTVIYEREVERDNPTASLLRDYQADVNAIHARVGLLLQIESEKTGTTDARLPLEKFKKIVEIRLSEEGHVGKSLQDLRDRLMTAAMHRLVFLVGLEQKQIGFEVRSLQEFMAAEGLMQGGDDDVPSRLRAIASISHWRNVFLFSAGRCFAERQHLRDTIYVICSELNEDSDQAIRQVLAGSRLAIDLLEDGPARRQPKYALSLFRVAFRVLDLPPTEYQTKLAALYGLDVEELFIEEFKKRLSLKNYHEQLGTWNAISVMNQRLAFVKKLKDENWPVEKREALQTVHYAGGRQEIYERLIPLLATFRPEELLNEFRLHFWTYSSDEQISKKLDVPEWFQAAMALVNSVAIGVPRVHLVLRVPESRSQQVLRTGLACFTEGQLSWLTPIKEMPNPNRGWQPLISAGSFLGNPSAEELARQLDVLAEAGGTNPNRTIGMVLPWPLAACVLGNSPTQVRYLADCAREGTLGDFADWAAAEQRWVSRGVTLEDLQHVTPQMPFDKNIAKVGFPTAARLGLSGDHVSQEPDTVLRTFDELIGTPLTSDLSQWAIWTLDERGEYRARRSTEYSCYKRLLEFFPVGGYVNLGALSLMFSGEIAADSIDSLDKLGRESSWFHATRHPYEPFVQELWKAFMANPTRMGVLRLLSELCGTTQMPEIPWDYLDPSKISDFRFRAAALLVLLTQKSLVDKVAELGRQAAGLGDELERFLSNATEVLRDRQVNLKLADRFLLEVIANLPPADWNSLGSALYGLDILVRKRKSHLDDASVWKELNLPTL